MRKNLRSALPVFVALGIGLTIAVVWSIRAGRAPQNSGLPGVPDYVFARDLAERYGPDRNSEEREEWIIRDFFKDARGGVFVDVGANDYRHRNNTYFLEQVLGWSGIAIDALPEFAEGYASNRPKTKFFALFVSDVPDLDATIYVPPTEYKRMASRDKAFAESGGEPSESRTVRTTTLDRLLEQEGISRIDFLNMDIELAEPQALAGFSIDLYKPRLVCIEAHAGVRQQILEYFMRHQYVLVGKYLGVDNDNYWFAPSGAVQDEPGQPHRH